MLELASVAARLVQFAAATVLFGTPLFLLYGLPAKGAGTATALAWSRPLAAAAAAILLPTAMAAVYLQTAVMAGSFSAGADLPSLWMVLTGLPLGWALICRCALAVAALVAIVALRRPAHLWIVLSAIGAVVVASFAWSGHGTSGDGAAGGFHLLGDILHLLAAAVWTGALVALGFLSADAAGLTRDPRRLGDLHGALRTFSGFGTATVAVLVATGLVNSWFLVGPGRLVGMVTTPYGRLLLLKLAVFAAMLVLAGLNRFRHTPALAEAAPATEALAQATAALRRSVLLETVAAFLVLILVSWLGTLAPVSAQ